jgi:hypothetical protein
MCRRPNQDIEAMRVLLVEDDRMIGAAVVEALKDAAYAVDWVRDGELAMEAIRSETYEIALLDLGLPRRASNAWSSANSRALRTVFSPKYDASRVAGSSWSLPLLRIGDAPLPSRRITARMRAKSSPTSNGLTR